MNTQYTRTLAVFMVALCLSGPASAGWLDKLKQTLGVGSGSEAGATAAAALSTGDIESGLKEALRVGTERVVGNLGQTDGFNLDPQVHIALPGELDTVKNMLEKVGMDSMLSDLELRLNRAAEIATPKAKSVVVQSIQEMSLDDVKGVYNGPEDAATQYFRGKMSAPLAEAMKPVIDESLGEVGAVTAYNDIMTRYNAIPLTPKVEADLGNYVVGKGMDGIFYYLAQEEAAIRKDPAKRTTEILKRVFGGQ